MTNVHLSLLMQEVMEQTLVEIAIRLEISNLHKLKSTNKSLT